VNAVKLAYDTQAIHRFCQERGISRLELFGSALRPDFGADSDVDLLFTVRPEVKCSLWDWAGWQEELASIFGRPVDLLSRRAVEKGQNPYRRKAILANTRPIYVEG
jgi:predicted nucleotidyltransferase